MRDYHYVLIDSRTGISDTSGICTVHLPDALVACFTANNQSIEGSAAVADSARLSRAAPSPAPRDARPALRVFPLLCRVESDDPDRLALRRELAKIEFRDTLGDLGDKAREEYWGQVQIPYKPFYAYEEVLSAFVDPPDDVLSMLAAVERLVHRLTDGEVSRLLDPPDDERRGSVRALYASHAKLKQVKLEPANEPAYDVYASHRATDRPAVRPILKALRDAGVTFWYDEWNLVPGQSWEDELPRALRRSRSAVVFIGPEGLGDWQKHEVLDLILKEYQNSNGRFRVIPALLPGAAWSDAPPELQRFYGVEFGPGSGRESEEAFRRLLDGIRGVATLQTPRGDECPYVGLRPFDVDDARFFFGARS